MNDMSGLKQNDTLETYYSKYRRLPTQNTKEYVEVKGYDLNKIDTSKTNTKLKV